MSFHPNELDRVHSFMPQLGNELDQIEILDRLLIRLLPPLLFPTKCPLLYYIQSILGVHLDCKLSLWMHCQNAKDSVKLCAVV